jgi:glycosyltransferase involved in cell wall biosynthesis
VLLPGHPVVGGPVLPAVALVEGLVVDDPRTGPKNAWSDRSTMNKIMEYMFFGLPVVGYELTENRVSAGPAALFAEPNRERALAGGIAELLDDPARREQMSLAGRERVRSVLAWEHSAPVLLAAYDRLWPVPSGGHVVDLAPRARQVRSRRVSRDAG